MNPTPARIFLGAEILRNGRLETGDAVVAGGRCAALGPGAGADPAWAGAERIDARGLWLLPGLVDLHVHLREPGFEHKETIATGTAAAAHGGYTTVFAMPNLNPVPDSPEHLARQLAAIEAGARVHVRPYGAITVGQRGGELVDFEALAPHVAGFSDDGRGVQREELMREAMRRVKPTGLRIVAHCEDDTLLHGGYIHDGAYARAHGHRGISSESEWRQVERDLRLVAETGCPYHVCHVSTAESVRLIRDAKRAGLPVSCETAPHYLLLTEEDLQEAGRFKMNPPLRGRADRDALIEGLLDGTVDAIATDHAPHTAEEKSRGLEKSAMGVVGLECAFGLLYTGLVRRQILPLDRLTALLSDNPRRLWGLEDPLRRGAPADWMFYDPAVETTVDPAQFLSKGKATPFEGWRLEGQVARTLVAGADAWQAPR